MKKIYSFICSSIMFFCTLCSIEFEEVIIEEEEVPLIIMQVDEIIDGIPKGHWEEVYVDWDKEVDDITISPPSNLYPPRTDR